MGYTVSQIMISPGTDAYDYFHRYAEKAKLLYNASLFRIRNIFTGYAKEHRTENELTVFTEVSALMRAYPSIHVRRVISYQHLEKLMRVTENPDFFCGLPMQTAQAVVKSAVSDFKNWLSALREYRKSPEKFLGRPQMPHYKRSNVATYTISNQDAVLYPAEAGIKLKLPLTKIRVPMSHLTADAVLKEVKVKPYYGRFLLCLTLEEPEPVIDKDMPNICAVDFGTENFAAIVCTDQSSRLYKGGAILSEIQWFQKQRADRIRILTKGHPYQRVSSRYLTDLSYHHANFIKDQCHKISRDMISFCIAHQAGTLVLGKNPLWKQKLCIGKRNTQKFVQMPIAYLCELITYKAANAGIKVIEQEESYTSKADVTAKDFMPVYGEDTPVAFSGKRISRGLYRCSNGLVIHADCNGAANIMRKAIPDAWNDVADYQFLAAPEVYGFHELNPKSIPVKRIAV